MKPALIQNINQQLALTAQLQAAICLLQLSNEQLNEEIQEFLVNNLFLEIDEENEINDFGSSDGAKAEGGELGAKEEIHDPIITAETEASPISDELPIDTDWVDPTDEIGLQSHTSPYEGSNIDLYQADENSLKNHLQWQIYLSKLNKTELLIANSIIDAIDDDGFFLESIDNIKKSLDIDVSDEEITYVLHYIQTLDPLGVGARNLPECMLIQLNKIAVDVPHINTVREIIREDFLALSKHDYNHLQRKYHLNQDELKEILKIIHSLNPRPGSSISSANIQYVVPDVIVKKKNSTWFVELNSEALPRLRINHQYSMLIGDIKGRNDRTFMKDQLNEAKWFLRSLSNRNQTLLKVSAYLVEHQRAFLEHGTVAMQPLLLREVADYLGVHESTISRVTTRKYIHTPQGVFELKHFFSNSLNTYNGQQCAATAIRAFIKDVIENESMANPLNDNSIARLLNDEKGVYISRRTIAKYRESMAIPPARRRKLCSFDNAQA